MYLFIGDDQYYTKYKTISRHSRQEENRCLGELLCQNSGNRSRVICQVLHCADEPGRDSDDEERMYDLEEEETRHQRKLDSRSRRDALYSSEDAENDRQEHHENGE